MNQIANFGFKLELNIAHFGKTSIFSRKQNIADPGKSYLQKNILNNAETHIYQKKKKMLKNKIFRLKRIS